MVPIAVLFDRRLVLEVSQDSVRVSGIEAVSDAGECFDRIVVPRCGKSAEIRIDSRFRRRQLGDDVLSPSG